MSGDVLAVAAIVALTLAAILSLVLGFTKDRPGLGLLVAATIMAIVCIFGVAMSSRESIRDNKACDAAGGRIYDAGRDTICVKDGKVIDI